MLWKCYDESTSKKEHTQLDDLWVRPQAIEAIQLIQAWPSKERKKERKYQDKRENLKKKQNKKETKFALYSLSYLFDRPTRQVIGRWTQSN